MKLSGANGGTAGEGRAVKAYRVTCVGKAVQDAPGDITHIGNTLDRWVMARATVVQHLELGTAAFYVLDEQTGQRSSVDFARDKGHRPYLFSHVAGQCNAQLGELEEMSQGRLGPV